MKDMRSKERIKNHTDTVIYVVRQCAYFMGDDRVKKFHYNEMEYKNNSYLSNPKFQYTQISYKREALKSKTLTLLLSCRWWCRIGIYIIRREKLEENIQKIILSVIINFLDRFF